MVYITNAEVAEHDVKEFLEKELPEKCGVEHTHIEDNLATVLMTDGSRLVVMLHTSGPEL